MLKPFKLNVFQLQMFERFVRGSDAASLQITFSTYYYITRYATIPAHNIDGTSPFVTLTK